MYEKLAFLDERYEKLSASIADPEVIADMDLWRKQMKEHAELTPIVEKYREYKKAVEEIKEAEEMLKTETDEEFKELYEKKDRHKQYGCSDDQPYRIKHKLRLSANRKFHCDLFQT